MKDFMPLNYRSRVLLAPQTTASATGGYVAPTAGVSALNVRCIATMGNAADLVLTLQYADDTSGTNAATFGYNVPIYTNGVRESSDAKAKTIGDATGNFIVDFCIEPAQIPAGKTIGVAYANSNAANLVVAELIENVAYKPTAS